jgi:hypothetical protein
MRWKTSKILGKEIDDDGSSKGRSTNITICSRIDAIFCRHDGRARKKDFGCVIGGSSTVSGNIPKW